MEAHVTEAEAMPMDGVTEEKAMPMDGVTETVAMPMGGVTETKAEAPPKEDMHDGDKDGGRWMT